MEKTKMTIEEKIRKLIGQQVEVFKKGRRIFAGSLDGYYENINTFAVRSSTDSFAAGTNTIKSVNVSKSIIYLK